LAAVSTSSPCIDAAIASKERVRSPIWSRDLDAMRTEKSPRATACVARVSLFTLRAIDPARTNAIARAAR
jgi:hypothetical protein